MYVDDIKLAGKKHNIDPMWKVLNKEVDLGEPTSFLDHVYLGWPGGWGHQGMSQTGGGGLARAGHKQNMAPMWKKLMNNADLNAPTSFLDHVYFGLTQRECKPNEIIIEESTKMFESRISAGAT